MWTQNIRLHTRDSDKLKKYKNLFFFFFEALILHPYIKVHTPLLKHNISDFQLAHVNI